MLYFAEDKLIESIGPFGIVGSVINLGDVAKRYKNQIDINSSQISPSMMPGQCQAFLTSSRKFVWFIEQYDMVPKLEDAGSDVPLVTFKNKKVYPAKVVGLSLALLGFSDTPTTVTVRWREGLIRHGSYYTAYQDATIPCLRPGFGETILADLKRPLESETVTTNNLGITGAKAGSTSFCGPLGRLMSMAFHVDEELAAQYDASKNKNKKVPLNSQDREETPTYPAYTPYQDNSGY